MNDNIFSLGSLNRLLKNNEALNLSDEELQRCASKSMAYFSVYKRLKKYRELGLLKINY